MANRNVFLVSTILLLISILSACGGGDNPKPPVIGQLPVDCSKPIPFNGWNSNLTEQQQDGSITSSRTLESGCYLVDAHLLIKNNATLTIRPRTVLLFTQEAGITVSNGNIIAAGNSSNPIYFTSQIKSPGSWVGIRIQERNQSDNIFDNVVIEYAGKSGFDRSRNVSYSFGIINISRSNNTGRVLFNNSAIHKSAGDFAVYIESNSNLESFSNNRIFDNNGYPVQISPEEAHLLNKSNQFTVNGKGNSINKISVTDKQNILNGTQNRIDNTDAVANSALKAMFWENLGIPYLVNYEILVFNTDLSVEAGTEIQFAPGAGLIIEPSASLQLRGNVNAPIKLTMDSNYVIGDDFQSSSWNGVQFVQSSSQLNRIEYTTFEYGGNVSDLKEAKRANLTVDGKSLVSIIASKFRRSNGYGMQLMDGCIVPEFKNNLLTFNQAGAAKVSSKAIKFFDNTSNFSSNTNDYIEVDSKGVDNGDHWPGLITPYAFFQNMFVDQNLTIEAGATLVFAENVRLEIKGDNSSLSVNGAPSRPVEFSSMQRVNPGAISYWHGIIFKASPSSLNKLDYANINNAGAAQLISNQPSAAISIVSENSRNSRVSISNTSISAPYFNAQGVFKDANSVLIQENNNNLYKVCDWQVTPGICPL